MEAKTIQKYQKKSLSTLLATATRVFNAYIRKRDSQGSYFVCISCQKPKSLSQMHAGHKYSAGQYPVTRFDEDNVHGQCIQCNTYLHGNLEEYRKNLIKKIGLKKVEVLDQKVGVAKREGFKWDRFYLVELIEKYKHK